MPLPEPWFGDIVDSATGAAENAIAVVVGLIADVLRFLLSLIQFIFKLLEILGGFLKRLVLSLGGLFRHLWRLGFRSIVHKVWGFIKDKFGALKDFLKEILCVIQTIIDYEEAVYNQFIRPLLNLIQRIRSLLVLLRLLHVKWAARLDARLFGIETRLSSLALVMLRELNTLRQFISLIINPFGLFNPVTLVASIFASIGDIWNALHVFRERPLFAAESAQIERNKHYMTVDYRREQMTAVVNGQPTDFDEEDAYRRQVMAAVVGGQPFQ